MQVQIVVNVTVHAPMSLKRYPYDRHIVPFCLGTRATKDAKGTFKNKWELSKEWPDWAPADYHEDKTMLSESQTTPDLEYHHKQCFAYLEGVKPILCVFIERPPKNVMKRVALPVCIVVCIALAVSGVEGNSFQEEYGAALTSLLTLTAFSYTVQSSLPKLTYLTLADIYFLVRTPALLRPAEPTHPTAPSTLLCILDQPRATAVWFFSPPHHRPQGHDRIPSVHRHHR